MFCVFLAATRILLKPNCADSKENEQANIGHDKTTKVQSGCVVCFRGIDKLSDEANNVHSVSPLKSEPLKTEKMCSSWEQEVIKFFSIVKKKII